MKRTVLCSIEHLRYASEEATLISIDQIELEHAIILFSALNQEIIDQILFVNKDETFSVCVTKKSHNSNSCIHAQINNDKYEAPGFWVDTVLTMLIRSHLCGWSQVDHIDQDLVTNGKIVTLCVCVNPP